MPLIFQQTLAPHISHQSDSLIYTSHVLFTKFWRWNSRGTCVVDKAKGTMKCLLCYMILGSTNIILEYVKERWWLPVGAFLISTSQLKIPPFGRCTFRRQSNLGCILHVCLMLLCSPFKISDNVRFLLWGEHNTPSGYPEAPCSRSGCNISITSASYKEAPGNNFVVLSSFKMLGID